MVLLPGLSSSSWSPLRIITCTATTNARDSADDARETAPAALSLGRLVSFGLGTPANFASHTNDSCASEWCLRNVRTSALLLANCSLRGFTYNDDPKPRKGYCDDNFRRRSLRAKLSLKNISLHVMLQKSALRASL